MASKPQMADRWLEVPKPLGERERRVAPAPKTIELKARTDAGPTRVSGNVVLEGR